MSRFAKLMLAAGLAFGACAAVVGGCYKGTPVCDPTTVDWPRCDPTQPPMVAHDAGADRE